MRFACLSLLLLMSSGEAYAQSYSHNYERFFGTDDRVGLYSEAAQTRFSGPVLKTIRDNTLLIECGSSGKPSTAFVAKSSKGSRIVSAAHNLTLAQTKNQDCKIGKEFLTDGEITKGFKDSGTLEDAAYDVAQWPDITSRVGFEICESLDTSAKYFLIQSMDGNGALGLSPFCKVKSVRGNLITTNCRGHYKASGAPLLAISKNKICVAGVFNAHSGRRFKYESYAARLNP